MQMRRILPLILALIMGWGLCGPAFAQGGDEYVFILGARGNPYWGVLGDGIRQTAKTKGMDAVVYDTENDSDAEGQLNLCQTAIQRKPKVIAMQSINPAIGIECFKQAQAAGIIVADIDSHLTVADAAKAGIDLAYTVGSDNTLIGRDAAKYVAASARKPNPKILIIEGAPGSLTSQKRVDGFKDGIKEMMPSAAIVASISAEWDQLKAMSITTDMLQRQADIDFVYAANDGMALGAAEAIKSDGKMGEIGIVGIDGIEAARKAVLAGTLSATVAQLPYLMGLKAAELAFDVVHGKKIEPVNVTPTPVLTADVLKAGSDPLLQYVR